MFRISLPFSIPILLSRKRFFFLIFKFFIVIIVEIKMQNLIGRNLGFELWRCLELFFIILTIFFKEFGPSLKEMNKKVAPGIESLVHLNVSIN